MFAKIETKKQVIFSNPINKLEKLSHDNVREWHASEL